MVVTLDTHSLGWRERARHHATKLPSCCAGAGELFSETVFRGLLTQTPDRIRWPRFSCEGKLFRIPALTWKDIGFLRRAYARSNSPTGEF